MVPASEDGLDSAVATTPRPGEPDHATLSTGPAPKSERMPDQQVGRYCLRARLGAGAMGEVWVATDPQLERDVAIKLVHPALARYPDASARMVREARAMAKVSHPGVIAIHDAGEADGQLFLAMELVRGRTLGALLRGRTSDERRDWRRWLAIAIDAGRGLAAAHHAGVLHRDFKPDNVMVDDRGRVCVGDFGLATLRNAPAQPASASQIEAGALASELTMEGALLGTPAYMSLEQLHGEPIDARSDQFSFCVTVYEAVYGESPFPLPLDEQLNLVTLEESRASGVVRPPPADTRVPAELRAILVRGLAPSPADRWPDLDALLGALSAVLAPRARPRTAFVAALAGIALLVAGLIVWELVRASVPHATALGAIPLHAKVAISPGGRIAIGTDHIEVRDLATGAIWTSHVEAHWVHGLQFDGDHVVRWSVAANQSPYRWNFDLHLPPVHERDQPSGVWLGSLDDDQLVTRGMPPSDTTLALVRGDRTLRAWNLESSSSQFIEVAPSKHRFAYTAGDRFSERIVVDDADSRAWSSPPIADLSAVGWLDDRTLLYGDANAPTLEAIDVGGDGRARIIYRIDGGFIGRVMASASDIVFERVDPKTRVRVIGRNPSRVRELESSVAAAELGWTADGAFLIWNRTTHALERMTAAGEHAPLAAQLDAEPKNATLAGDLALVAEVGEGGRVLTAVSLSTGAVAWRDPAGKSLAARCARDLAPPCYVARRAVDAAEIYEIAPLDPRTGVTIGAPVYRGPVSDFAISGDGHRILVASGHTMTEVDDGGARTGMYDIGSIGVRSIAYDPLGGTLIGATNAAGAYVLGHFDGSTFTAFNVVDGELLSLVRPSPKTDEVLAQGRTLTASLWRIPRP